MTPGTPLPILQAAWSTKGRTSYVIQVDPGRLALLHQLAERYGRTMGRPVSVSLMTQRALDLLSQHLDEIEDSPSAVTLEALTLLGEARHPIREDETMTA